MSEGSAAQARARARDAHRTRSDPPARDRARHDAGRTGSDPRDHGYREGRVATMSQAKKLKPMTPGVSSGARTRAYLTGAVVTLGLCGVGARAWGLQVDDGDHYRALAVCLFVLRFVLLVSCGVVFVFLGVLFV